ncbi:MAG: hypothetical protein WA637_21265, partial [Terriglobales bacterium]
SSLLEEGMGMLKNLGLGKTGTDSYAQATWGQPPPAVPSSGVGRTLPSTSLRAGSVRWPCLGS